MTRKKQTGFVPAPDDTPSDPVAEPLAAEQEVSAVEAPKVYRYTGPPYRGKLMLPPFTVPVDPKTWTDAAIRSFIRKWPHLERYFTES